MPTPFPDTLLEPSLQLRHMVMADLDAVMAIETEVHSHPWKRSHFENCLQIGNLAVVVEEASGNLPGALVAFAVISYGGGEAELLNVAVAQARQQQGVAGRVLQTLIHWIEEKADTIFLEVRRSNHRAISLYDRLGFNQVGERRNYYPSRDGREDALIFALTLLSDSTSNSA